MKYDSHYQIMRTRFGLKLIKVYLIDGKNSSHHEADPIIFFKDKESVICTLEQMLTDAKKYPVIKQNEIKRLEREK